MLLSDITYDRLKYIAIYVIPSIATFVGVVGVSVQWEHTAIATTIITAVGSLIAGCIGMSVLAYDKAVKAEHEGEPDA